MFQLLLGHIVGDYFLQWHWMALQKSKPGMDGVKACMIHSIIYTICIMVCLVFVYPPLTLSWGSAWFLGVTACGIWLSHYPIDRYSLVKIIMYFKGGPDVNNPFAPVIYIFLDNTMHIVLMYYWLTLGMGVKL